VSLKDHPSIKPFVEYVLSKTNSDLALHAVLEETLAPSSHTHIGLILSERLVNMPVQVVPPMYRMLADEIKWAVEEVTPCPFYLAKFRTNLPTARENPLISSTTSF
jgi:protein BCP1